ncbi:MAG: hypothetical protein U0P45_03930 [Acidimicrobiales bacterium]
MAETDNPDDLAALAAAADALAAGVEAALPSWLARSTLQVAAAWDPEVAAGLGEEAAAAGRAALAEVAPALRALLGTDVDEQRTGPLDVIRSAVPHATRVLAGAGVPAVPRDEVRARLFPDDRYDLAPSAFTDLGPELGDVGIAWGAAKAYVVLARRRREGRR